MLVRTIEGELLEVVTSQTFSADFNQIKSNSRVMCRNYQSTLKKDGSFRFDLIIRMYLKSGLTYVSPHNFENPNNYLKETIMSFSSMIIKAANEHGQQGIATVLNKRMKKALERAERVATLENEFAAMACIKKELKQFASTSSEKKEIPADAKSFNLTRDVKAVPEEIWEAVIEKVEKIGVISKFSQSAASISLPQKESQAYVKAVSGIKGLAINEVKATK